MSTTKETANGDPSALSASPVAAATETPNENMVERFSLLQQTRWSRCWQTQQRWKHREELKAKREALRVPKLTAAHYALCYTMAVECKRLQMLENWEPIRDQLVLNRCQKCVRYVTKDPMHQCVSARDKSVRCIRSRFSVKNYQSVGIRIKDSSKRTMLRIPCISL